MNPVFYNNQEYSELLQYFERLMQEAEQSPFPQVNEIVIGILKYFDLIHREPLARLMKNLETNHPELLESLEKDYTIKTLFSLYDLVEGDIERNPLDKPGTVGFVPESNIGILE